MIGRKPYTSAILLLISTAVLAAGVTVDAGWLPGWTCRQEITVDPSVTSGDLTEFPLLVQVTDPANSVFDNASSPDGLDIVFTAANGTTPLLREIESFSTGATNELNAWVKTNVSSTAPTTLYMYYNGPTSPNATATWDSNFKMVQHLQESSAAASSRIDSTGGNPNDGSPYNGSTLADLHTNSGKIGGADEFDGGADDETDRVYFGNDASLGTPTNGTIDFWVNAYGRGSWSGNNQEGKVNLNYGPLLYGVGRIQIYWAGASNEYPGGYSFDDNEWTHVAVAWENAGSGTDDGVIYWYKNGILERTLGSLTLPQRSPSAEIGRYGGNSPLNGALDEVRISDIARDSHWLMATYRSANNPDDFLTFGPVEVPEPSTFVLCALGGLALAWRRRRR